MPEPGTGRGPRHPPRPSELSALLHGRYRKRCGSQLPHAPRLHRYAIAAHLCEQLTDLPGIIVPTSPEGVRSSWYGLPLFQEPDPLFPLYNGKIEYKTGDFPNAEAIHHGTIKMPVWHHENDIPLVNSYIEAFRKVIDNYHDLLG